MVSSRFWRRSWRSAFFRTSSKTFSLQSTLMESKYGVQFIFILQLYHSMKEDDPFQEDKLFFQQMPIAQRAGWIQKMLKVPQKQGQYPVYRGEYPSQAKWNFKGTTLHYHCSQKYGKKPKAILFFFHGLNGYGGYSGYFSQCLSQKCQVNIYANDFKNFGQSEGERGFHPPIEDLVEEAEGFIAYICQKYEQNIPIYISGVSFGGAICFKLGIRNPERYEGVVFLCPALRENRYASPYLKKVGKIVARLFPKQKWLKQTFDDGTKFHQADRYRNDPYFYSDNMALASAANALKAMQQIEGEWDKFKCGFMLIQGGMDKLLDPFNGVDFEARCSSTDKTVIYCKQMWHDVCFEEQFPQLMKLVVQWVNQRLK